MIRSKYLPSTELADSADIENYFNLQYYATFDVGTPSQELTLILDTGSSWTWVPKLDCDCHNSASQFDPSKSSSYKSSKTTLNEAYGMGWLSGTYGEESFSIASLKAESQSFILVLSDKDFDGLASDGLLGLAFATLSGNYPTFIETLMSKGQIDNKIFSFYLGNYDDYLIKSEFTIGGSNAENYETKGTTVINIQKDQGFWISTVESVSFGDYTIDSNTFAILDTGTSYIYGPDEEIKEIFTRIKEVLKCQEDSMLICECTQSDISLLSILTIEIDKNPYEIHPKNYVYFESNYCYILMYYINDVYWLVGQPIFRDYYTVHNMEELTITMHALNGNGRGINYLYFVGAGLVVLTGFISYYCICVKGSPTNYQRLNT